MPAFRSILCIHGVGHQEQNAGFRAAWQQAILAAVQSASPDAQPAIDFLEYDALFQHAPLNFITYSTALGRLVASAAVHGVGDVLGRSRALSDVPETIGATAGMVAQWATEEDLRAKTRDALLAIMKTRDYDAICAHSLGSLIAYDTFARNPGHLEGKVLVTLGAQIGHPAVRDVFAGRIVSVGARRWYHLYNSNDHVLTYPIKLAGDDFQQVSTDFDIPNDALNHDATWYFGHANTIATVWHDLTVGPQPKAISRGLERAFSRPIRRALLIGINDYPDPANRLEGCINDTYLVSAVLQESGFDASEIRVVLDDRATASGIMDRLHWLLDEVQPGDERVLFYSGHGAQLPTYGPHGEPDHYDECLVPHDFDWSPAHAVTDKQFLELYSQLPYESHFVAIFDCCHSGGLTRDGGPRVRGLNPPDDIRHRALRWNAEEQMWVARDFTPLNKSLAKSEEGEKYVGENGATNRIGRAVPLRTTPPKEYDAARRAYGHLGPYLPVLMEACKEAELSYEYRDGATSYGAYTFCLANVLRRSRARGANMTFRQLSDQVSEKLKRLAYRQTPDLVGVDEILSQPLPWSTAPKPKRATRPKARNRTKKKAAKKR